MAKKTVAAKKRNVKVDANGQLHVHSSFNNIIVSLAKQARKVLDINKSERHIRGGLATREKYLHQH